MKEILLTWGLFALIDERDYDLISQYKWHYSKSCKSHGYARRSSPDRKYLHRLIAEIKYDKIPAGILIDHKNRNTLDCRRENIRLASSQENMLNRTEHGSAHTQYKGIEYDARHHLWNCRISILGKRINVGSFRSDYDAALAHDIYARKYYNLDFYTLNFPNMTKEQYIYIEDVIKNLKRRNINTSKYKGVFKEKRSGLFIAYIYYAPNKKIQIGSFKNETDAALAYTLKAFELFGENATLNEI